MTEIRGHVSRFTQTIWISSLNGISKIFQGYFYATDVEMVEVYCAVFADKTAGGKNANGSFKVALKWFLISYFLDRC